MSQWQMVIVILCAISGSGFMIAIAAFVNGEKLRKRLNYMQEVLIKKGLVGEYELTLALGGMKIHDEDDSE